MSRRIHNPLKIRGLIVFIPSASARMGHMARRPVEKYNNPAAKCYNLLTNRFYCLLVQLLAPLPPRDACIVGLCDTRSLRVCGRRGG
jgi:hypothetical protein